MAEPETTSDHSVEPRVSQGHVDTHQHLWEARVRLAGLALEYGERHPELIATEARVESFTISAERTVLSATQRCRLRDVLNALAAELDATAAERSVHLGERHLDMRKLRAQQAVLAGARDNTRCEANVGEQEPDVEEQANPEV